MVDRVCISINNRCNLNCKYCHFHEKSEFIEKANMDVIEILDNIITYINEKKIELFKIGFVGNGEPLLEYKELQRYILYISDYLKSGRIAAYTITNGILVNREMLEFFKSYNVNLGFSIDGLASIHDQYRCGTHDKVIEKIELYKEVFGNYPSMNCTVGAETLEKAEETISYFKKYDAKITFSRMIGKYGISLESFNNFLNTASKHLNVRRGGYDCTMYGGKCGAGMNNFFFANGKVFLCGNCVDLPALADSCETLDNLDKVTLDFDRKHCYKESLCE